MAALSKNKWYTWYLREVAAGRLELPGYEKVENGEIKVYYGEVYCHRTAPKRKTHVKSHENVVLNDENAGGRVAQTVIDEAVQWYKQLFCGASLLYGGESSAPAGDASSVGAASADAGPPPLPLKKDGTPHVTNMRKKVIEMGYKVPCKSCGSRNDCCKDINKCDHFILFECGDIRPDVVDNGKGKAAVRDPPDGEDAPPTGDAEEN